MSCKTPKLKMEFEKESSDNEQSIQSNGSEGSTDSSDLNIVAEFDDLMRLVKLKRNDEIENAFINYVEFTFEVLKRLEKSEAECRRIQVELDNKIQEFTDLEGKLTWARKLLDQEKKKTKKALRERDVLERQLSQVRDLLFRDNHHAFPDDARERLAFLNNLHYANSEMGDRDAPGMPDLSAIPENTTGSLLSDFSYSRSGDEDVKHLSGWKTHRPSSEYGGEPAIKKRRSSASKVVEISGVDKVRATTTVMVPRDGPITATSVIEAIPPQEAARHCSQTPTRNKTSTFAKGNGTVNTNRPHTFLTKIVVMPENCTVCEKRIRFGKMAFKCKECRASCHPECKDTLPVPCVPTTNTPNQKGGPMGVIGEYTPTTAPMVPSLIIHCVKEVEERGLKEMGIYRIPGSEREVKLLKERFLHGKGAPPLNQIDIHVICGTIKDFLRSLMEPLVTYAHWPDFMNAIQANDPKDIAPALYQCISELPQPNRDTLAYMVLHLKKIAQSPECKMPATNLAKVFGPTIVGYSSADPLPQSVLDETRLQARVMEELLKLPEDYWSNFVSSTPKYPLQQTASTESLLRPGAKAACASHFRVARRKQKFFPSPIGK